MQAAAGEVITLFAYAEYFPLFRNICLDSVAVDAAEDSGDHRHDEAYILLPPALCFYSRMR